ncbi:MAG TPA: hypothetical protein ENI04_00945 [Candidatus Wildermuthbacteria bacterium]|nr:hypothetical protein [Candidatus Wildermuthbacteria bacterium]
MKRADFLRRHHPQFFYLDYTWNLKGKNLVIAFDFSCPPNIRFAPSLIIKNVSATDIKRVGEDVLNNLVFNLGMAELLSYWKATASPEITVRTGNLTKTQISWWHYLLEKGMGQFFYENQIDFQKSGFVKITSMPDSKKKGRVYKKRLKDRALIPIGGGKDGVVTLETLKKDKKQIRAFLLNPTAAQKAVLRVSKEKNPIIVERTLDPRLLALNRQGYLNGHTPFSAYLAFLGVLVATLFDYKDIVLSNERSSNEGNVEYLGQTVNHQYSKTYDFEKRFRAYSTSFLASFANYFSFLRPLYEIQIARMFSRNSKYFSASLSCNEAHKTYSGTKKPRGTWCGVCSKCLFVFIILSPFISEKKLVKIFGLNLFSNKKLLPILKELTGMARFKPFECVGTEKETIAALFLARNGYAKLPYLLKYADKEILPKYPNIKREAERILSSWNARNALPRDYTKLLSHEAFKAQE